MMSPLSFSPYFKCSDCISILLFSLSLSYLLFLSLLSLLLASINVVRKKQLSDSRWTKGRIVSSMAWSPHVRY